MQKPNLGKVEDLLNYLEKCALAMENVSVPQSLPLKTVHAVTNKLKEKPRCHYCKCEDHRTHLCKSFKLLPSAQRLSFVSKASLCNICLNKHTGKCRFHFRCAQCKQSHHTLLHKDIEKVEPVIMLSRNNTNNVLIPTARVKLYAKDGREVHVKAILDSASQASLIISKAVGVLGLTPMREHTNIMGVSNTKNHIKYCIPL